MTEKPPVIHWFRRDLRLIDNTALLEALQSGHRVITVFVFDPAILNSRYMSDARMGFLLDGLANLRTDIHHAGGRLLFYQGNPHQVLPQLVRETSSVAVYCNTDYTPYATQRDKELEQLLSIPLKSYDDAVIMPPGSVLTNKGTPYTVYTPFKKKWRSQSKGQTITVREEVPDNFYQIQHIDAHDLPSLEDLGFSMPHAIPQASAAAATERLSQFLQTGIYTYSDGRNELTLHPFNGPAGTSQLSPYFRMGMLSPRQAVASARQVYRNIKEANTKATESVNDWVDELIWREFYMHIMAHFPQVYSGNFREEYDDLEWEDNNEALQAWKNGETGYPIVDAAMRQLKATGWMPNRARMIVASFLTKDLLINWREGEAHFMQHLLDGDPAANNGGWQWAAGTGTDAQPYFRIFNPTSQAERYDPNGDYVREWVPELAAISGKAVHSPWNLKQQPTDYPTPIVDHKQARERTLSAFKAVRADN